jgi:hypothetical protein
MTLELSLELRLTKADLLPLLSYAHDGERRGIEALTQRVFASAFQLSVRLTQDPTIATTAARESLTRLIAISYRLTPSVDPCLTMHRLLLGRLERLTKAADHQLKAHSCRARSRQTQLLRAPLELRAALVLRHLYDWDRAPLAQLFSIDARALESRLGRARDALANSVDTALGRDPRSLLDSLLPSAEAPAAPCLAELEAEANAMTTASILSRALTRSPSASIGP